MIYSDVFSSNGEGIFKYLNHDLTVDKSTLNIMLYSMYKSRTISPLVTMFYNSETRTISDEDLKKIGLVINANLSSYWLKLEKYSKVEYDATKPYYIIKTTNSTGTNNQKHNRTNRNSENINGFDSVDSVPTRDNTEDETVTYDTDTSNKYEESTQGNNTALDIIANVKKDIDASLDYNLVKKFVQSVGDCLTIPVYETNEF